MTILKPLLLVLISLTFGLLGNAQLDSIYVEIIEHDGALIPELAGQTTYRVYAQLSNDSDYLDYMYGSEECSVEISSSTTFYRHEIFSGILLQNINPDILSILPALEFSSGLTIGLINFR